MSPLFPDILFLGPYFAPPVLRIGIALYFLLHALALWKAGGKRGQLLAGKEAVFGLLLAAGFFVQLVAALGILVVLLRGMWLQKDAAKEPWHEKLLAIAVLAALVISGGGAFAIDLPY